MDRCFRKDTPHEEVYIAMRDNHGEIVSTWYCMS